MSDKIINFKLDLTDDVLKVLEDSYTPRMLRSISHSVFVNNNSNEGVKCRLIIEFPERKILINESDFRKAWNEAQTECLIKPDYDDLLNALFGEDK